MKSLKELLLTEEDLRPAPPYQIYCDMDGVLCNFDARFDHYTGMLPNEYEEEKQRQYGKKKGTEMFWDLIDNQVGIKFWSEMEWTPKGKELWDFIKNYNPELLTSPSKQETSRLGKQLWVKNHLSPAPKVNFKYSKEKHHFATPDSILIDDREDIINNWNAAGGIGIHHPKNTSNIEPILNTLRELGYE